jgi:predicted transcriptional regulator
MRQDGSGSGTGAEEGKLDCETDEQIEIERLTGELSACHESYIRQLNISAALREEVRLLADVARQKAELMDRLHKNLEENAPPVFEILRSLERISAVQKPVRRLLPAAERVT